MSGGEWAARYFVPWSQVHPNSTGAQSGKVHLCWHASAPDRGPVELTAKAGRATTIRRVHGQPICGRKKTKRSPWYDREPSMETDADRCPRCVEVAERYGVAWPWSVPAPVGR